MVERCGVPWEPLIFGRTFPSSHLIRRLWSGWAQPLAKRRRHVASELSRPASDRKGPTELARGQALASGGGDCEVASSHRTGAGSQQ
jgi:hypothetical protein